MSTNQRLALVALAATTATAMLVGCGSSNEADQASTETNTSQIATATEDAAEKVSDFTWLDADEAMSYTGTDGGSYETTFGNVVRSAGQTCFDNVFHIAEASSPDAEQDLSTLDGILGDSEAIEIISRDFNTVSPTATINEVTDSGTIGRELKPTLTPAPTGSTFDAVSRTATENYCVDSDSEIVISAKFTPAYVTAPDDIRGWKL